MTVRTTTPNNYILPSREEMQAAAQQINLEGFCPSLVEDVCNLAAGGDYILPSSMQGRIEGVLWESPSWGNDGGGDITFNGSCVTVNGRYTKDLATAVRGRAASEIQYHERVQDFLRAIDLSAIPGSSPLEQAMGLLKLLATQSGGSGSGESLPIFNNSKAVPETIAETILEAIKLSESLDQIEQELLELGDASTLKIAGEMLSGKKLIVKIGRQMAKLAKFKRKPINQFEVDPEGEHIQYRAMQDLSEVSKMPLTEFLYPAAYRAYRLATLEPVVKERTRQISRKVDLTVMVDCSGSMRSNNRFYRAGGVLMHLLKEVCLGYSEVTFYFFDDKLGKECRVTNPDEAKEVMRLIQSRNFNGGGTEIANCTRAAIPKIWERVEQAEHLDKPELVIVSDGEDDCSSLTLTNLDGVKLHSFLTECDNTHLVKLAQRSGGVGFTKL